MYLQGYFCIEDYFLKKKTLTQNCHTPSHKKDEQNILT